MQFATTGVAAPEFVTVRPAGVYSLRVITPKKSFSVFSMNFLS